MERTGDREHIQVYHPFEGDMEDIIACKEAVSCNLDKTVIPSGQFFSMTELPLLQKFQ